MGRDGNREVGVGNEMTVEDDGGVGGRVAIGEVQEWNKKSRTVLSGLGARKPASCPASALWLGVDYGPL